MIPPILHKKPVPTICHVPYTERVSPVCSIYVYLSSLVKNPLLFCILMLFTVVHFSVAGRLDSVPHTKITLRVLTNRRPEEIKISSIVNFKIITSLVSHLRLFKSLKYLEHSPLINIILKPKARDFTILNITQDTLISKVCCTSNTAKIRGKNYFMDVACFNGIENCSIFE